MYWSTLKSADFSAIDRLIPVILPVAAIEQHGSHLPLNTDCLINDAICSGLSDALDNRVLILPTQSIGCSQHHMSFPGSLTLSHNTYRCVVFEVVAAVVQHGFTRVLILNSHGGNQAINGVLGEQLGHEFPKTECIVTNWWTPCTGELMRIQEGSLGSVGHACEFETSIMLEIAADLVDMTTAEDGGLQPRVEALHFDMLTRPAATYYRPFERLSHSGVYGAPTLASAEKGRKILQVTVASLAQLVRDFWPPPSGNT